MSGPGSVDGERRTHGLSGTTSPLRRQSVPNKIIHFDERYCCSATLLLEGVNDNGNVPDSSQVTPQNAVDVFAVFDGRERQQVIRALLTRHTATLAELAALVGGSSAMVARHVAILEDLGVVTLDVPKGARRGRTVNATINRTAYASALGEWLREMGGDA